MVKFLHKKNSISRLFLLFFQQFCVQTIGHQQPELMLSIIESVVVPGTIVMTKHWLSFQQTYLDQGIFTEGNQVRLQSLQNATYIYI